MEARITGARIVLSQFVRGQRFSYPDLISGRFPGIAKSCIGTTFTDASESVGTPLRAGQPEEAVQVAKGLTARPDVPDDLRAAAECVATGLR
jgi:hypothetical protein